MLEIFRLEAEEHLRTVSASLVVLDRTPGDRPTLKDIRRSAHTLKGAAAVVGFQSVTKLAHRMEDLLDALYDHDRPATPALTSLLLAATEQLEQLVGGTPPSELAHSLETTYQQFDSILPIVQAGGVVEAIGARSVPSSSARIRRCRPRRADASDASRRWPRRTPYADDAAAVSEEPQTAGRAHRRRGPPSVGVDPHAVDADADAEPEEAEAVAPSSAANDAAMADAAAAAGARQFVRVPLAKLDGVSKLMGELVISRTALEQRVAQLELANRRAAPQHEPPAPRLGADRVRVRDHRPAARTRLRRHRHRGSAPSEASPSALTAPAGDRRRSRVQRTWFDRYTEFHRLTREMSEATSDSLAVRTELENLLGDFDSLLNRQRRLANDVQESVMRMRMVPLRTLATRLHRTVRVTADRQGKQAELVLEGDTLELDSQVLDSMARAAAPHAAQLGRPRPRDAGRPALAAASRRAAASGCRPTTKARRPCCASATTAAASTPSSCARRRSAAASSPPSAPPRSATPT